MTDANEILRDLQASKVSAARAREIAEARRPCAGNRVVIAVVGVDRPGILAGVTAILAACNANILDVSQTTMSELFTMLMLVDVKNITKTVAALKQELEEHGARQGLTVVMQQEELFRAMHRV